MKILILIGLIIISPLLRVASATTNLLVNASIDLINEEGDRP